MKVPDMLELQLDCSFIANGKASDEMNWIKTKNKRLLGKQA